MSGDDRQTLQRRRLFGGRCHPHDRSSRPSTRKVYESKLEEFVDWSHERGISACRASIPQVADFLDTGERSRAYDPDEKPSPSFSNPTARSRTPRCDPTVALSSLLEEPFEPLETAQLKYLSHKTVFLLAFASAKRVSELQALSGSSQPNQTGRRSHSSSRKISWKNDRAEGQRGTPVPILGRHPSVTKNTTDHERHMTEITSTCTDCIKYPHMKSEHSPHRGSSSTRYP